METQEETLTPSENLSEEKEIPFDESKDLATEDEIIGLDENIVVRDGYKIYILDTIEEQKTINELRESGKAIGQMSVAETKELVLLVKD